MVLLVGGSSGKSYEIKGIWLVLGRVIAEIPSDLVFKATERPMKQRVLGQRLYPK